MGSKNYETPPDYFRERWKLHEFTVDAAASDANALLRPCPSNEWHTDHFLGRYYTEETDGLDASHYQRGDRVWCNPPYDSSIIRWVKLARELSRDAGILWDLLLPSSTSPEWFKRYIWDDRGQHFRDGVEGHFVGRIQFLLDGQPIRDVKTGKVMSSRQDNLQVTFWPEVQR